MGKLIKIFQTGMWRWIREEEAKSSERTLMGEDRTGPRQCSRERRRELWERH